MSGQILFISAIDTGCGKSLVTGSLARFLLLKGKKVITQKLVQTGCTGFSEDIQTHREIMESPGFPEDTQGLTCPYIFSFPASPHLASHLEQKIIDPSFLSQTTRILAQRYEIVLLEGVGGLMVPLTAQTTVLDYVAGEGYPLLLVTCGRLGSINHTLLSLHACKEAGIEVTALVYNRFPGVDERIARDTYFYFSQVLTKLYPKAVLVDFPLQDGGHPEQDFWEEFYVRRQAK